jgi:hypothetical protein
MEETDEPTEPEQPKYRCTECGWTGDDYDRVEDGSMGGTAVCGSEGGCTGQLKLNRVPDHA